MYEHSYSNYRYSLWKSIKKRCFLETYQDYYWYGARGISMHDPWVNSFERFVCDLMDEIGDRPEGTVLGRIDCNEDYKPGNLRWATMKEQSNVRRSRSCKKLSV